MIATKTDRNGKTTNFKYDIHGRLISKIIDADEISYSYDANGNQLTITDSTGITARSYDELNRVIIKSVPNIGAITFQYDIIASKDNIAELASYTIPTGYTAERSKDPKGNITTKVSDLSGRLVYVIADGKVTSYTYDVNGNRVSVVYPGTNAKEYYTYYDDNLLYTLTNTVKGVEKDKYTYTYDGAHNQLTQEEKINEKIKGTTSYSYDCLNRLTEVREPKKDTEFSGKLTQYTYDAAGNRETEKVTVSETIGTSISQITYRYNEQNRLLSTAQEQTDGTIKTTTYVYDNNGNLTKKNMEQIRKVDPSNPPKEKFGLFIEGQPETASVNARDIMKGTVSYEYNGWNQLVKARTGEGTSTYQYNGEGYRTERTEDGITTRSLYEADKVILETDKKGKQIARNVYGTNLLVRTVGADTFYYMYNGHADVTALVDDNNRIRAMYDYDAFGTPDSTGTKYFDASGNPTNEAVKNTITFAGYQYDKSTELYYLNARYYDSVTARFTSEDTYTGTANDPLSLNLYTYCHNEPIMYIDPSGHINIPFLTLNLPLIAYSPTIFTPSNIPSPTSGTSSTTGAISTAMKIASSGGSSVPTPVIETVPSAVERAASSTIGGAIGKAIKTVSTGGSSVPTPAIETVPSSGSLVPTPAIETVSSTGSIVPSSNGTQTITSTKDTDDIQSFAIDHVNYTKLNSTFWNNSSYFDVAAKWWLNNGKLQVARAVLQSEIEKYGPMPINGNMGYSCFVDNNRMNTLQALTGSLVTGYYNDNTIAQLQNISTVMGSDYNDMNHCVSLEFLNEITLWRDKYYRGNAEWLEKGGMQVIEGLSIFISSAVIAKSSEIKSLFLKMFNKGTINLAQYGDEIGNLGIMVENPNIKPNWDTAQQHMLNRMKQKGVTVEMYDSWVQNGTAIQQDANTILYLNKDGVAVMSTSGRPITTYGADSFKGHIMDAIKQVFGK